MVRTLVPLLLAVSLTLTLAAGTPAAEKTLTLSVSAGKHDRTNVPVRAVVPAAGLKAGEAATLTDGQGQAIAGQLAAPSLVEQAAKPDTLVLHFVVPKLAKGETKKLTARFGAAPSARVFVWKDTPGEYTDLLYGDRPVMRYMYKALDPASREATYKVYHHVYDFAGENFLTKGPGSKYTHHRGIFFGYCRVSYEDGKADTWGCSGESYLSHEGFLASEAGPVLGRHTVAVDWHGTGKKVFAKEQRQLGMYHTPGGYLIEFASRLKSAVGPVKLSGDPQHAGVHFRAAAEVAEQTAKQTYYLRPDGKGNLGETRNWGKSGDAHANLPWNAMSFVTGGKRYTCVYLDHPKNPKEARYSERDYGRFGSYFEYELDADKDLLVNYRLWIQEGEMTVEEAAALSADFVEPVAVTVE